MKGLKAKIAILLVVIMTFTALFSAVGTTSALVGDFNGSGTLSSSDAVYLLYHTLFGGEEYPITQNGDVNGDGRLDSDDATFLLFNVLFGDDDYPMSYVNVTLNNNGVINTYEMLKGSELKPAANLHADSFELCEFDGWYDVTLTNKYTTVPDTDITLYAKYDNYRYYTFDKGGYFDPNNAGNITAVDDPFGGEGKVLYSPIINRNDSVYKGHYRGFVPSAADGISNSAFEFEKNHTYRISFDYRFAEGTSIDASCKLKFYGVARDGIYKQGNKTDTFGGSKSLKYSSGWKTVTFDVTNITNYEYLFIMFIGGSSTVVYDFYTDNLEIIDITPVEGVKLINGGVEELTELKAGDALPTLENYKDELCDYTFEFDGWYDESLTTKYTTVDANVDTYYAKYNNYTTLSFETNGMYDPNNSYSATSGANAPWYRAWDPTGADNLCLRVKLNKNGNNTHVALSGTEGIDGGFILKPDRKYVMTFDYYVDYADGVPSNFIQCRGCKTENIGTNSGKTDGLGSTKLNKSKQWTRGSVTIETGSSVSECPNLIFMMQVDKTVENLVVYFDNFRIREFDVDTDIKIYTMADNVTLNDNGAISTIEESYVSSALPDGTYYYGAEFLGWYNDKLNVKYPYVPETNAKLYSKYDGAVVNFENGGYYNPNNNFGKGSSSFSIVENPTDASDKVIKVSLKNDVGNKHFALPLSGYNNDEGYKLTVGNTYTISFMYYAEDLNESGVTVQFRGCKKSNIGIGGGKSKAQGVKYLKTEKSWTGVTAKFKYSGAELEDELSPYLLMLVQDGANSKGASACTATVYIDDIVIKETVPEKTYIKKDVKIGEWTVGVDARPHNIVIPSTNFSYLAMMQCEELAEVIEGITSNSTQVNIVYEKDWTEASNQFNIFVGDVKGHSRDNSNKVNTTGFGKEDYAYSFGKGNVYIDGGSTYALAMGISEFAKALELATDGHKFATGSKVSGKYSENIDSYSSATYYRPAFLEDFDQEDIDTTIWEVADKLEGSARDFVDENGVVHYDGVIDDEKNTPVEGENHGWKRTRSAKHTYLSEGKLVIEGAYANEYKLFYGGMLRSHNRMEFLYGYVEASCITAHGQSLWSSVWMTPAGSTSGLFRPEIDINESFGDARYSAFNMHTWPTTAGGNLGKVHYSLDRSYFDAKRAYAGDGNKFSDGFHTFGTLWTPDGCKFTVDGKVYFEYNYVPGNKYYNDDIDTFHERMSLTVSMTVGNRSSGSDPVLGAPYWNTTNKYVVDYVHIYQIDGQDIFFTPQESVEIDRTDLGIKMQQN